VINTGSGFEISIGDTTRLIAEVMKADVTVIRDDKRLRPQASEVERLCANISRAESKLGWKPEFGGREGFARALVRTVDWFRDPANLGRFKAGCYNI
jgi:dTDP-glucose 4,6-dehydratase